MSKLIKIVKNELKVLDGKSYYIAKNDKEKFDFANATKWANKLNGPEASDVLMVKTWEDVGTPKAYQNWVKQMKEGAYLSNFTPERRDTVLDAMKDRVGKTFIQFSVSPRDRRAKEIVKGISIKA